MMNLDVTLFTEKELDSLFLLLVMLLLSRYWLLDIPYISLSSFFVAKKSLKNDTQYVNLVSPHEINILSSLTHLLQTLTVCPLCFQPFTPHLWSIAQLCVERKGDGFGPESKMTSEVFLYKTEI